MSSDLWVQIAMYRQLAHWRWTQQQSFMGVEQVRVAQHGKDRKRTYSEMNEVELY